MSVMRTRRSVYRLDDEERVAKSLARLARAQEAVLRKDLNSLDYYIYELLKAWLCKRANL